MVADVNGLSDGKRTPLLPSAADNGIGAARRTRSGEVASRYSSSSSNSSAVSRSTVRSIPAAHTASSAKRSQSVERRGLGTLRPNRDGLIPVAVAVADTVLVSSPVIKAKAIPATNYSKIERKGTPERPGTAGEMSTAAKLLISSRRSMSVSFEGRSFPLPVIKAKATPATNYLRKATPERPRTSGETSTAAKLLVSSRRSSSASFQGDPLPQLTLDRKKATPVRNHQNGHSKADQRRWPGRSKQSSSPSTSLNLDNESIKVVEDANIVNIQSTSSGQVTSDVESISTGSYDAPKRVGPRGIIVPSRFWQETTSRLKQISTPVINPIIHNPYSKKGGLSSPITSAIRPSPSLIRNSNKIEDAHMLRLLHNQHLQWRFINARAVTSMLELEASAKKSSYNCWVSTAKLQYHVESRKLELQMMRHNLKLYYIIKGQSLFSDDWNVICNDHSSFLSEAAKALEATTIRLPVVSGVTKVDIQDIKEVISSSFEVMQAIKSNICTFITKAQQTNASILELAIMAAKECDLINECKDLLTALTALQVKDCSLRTYILQLRPQKHPPQSHDLCPQIA